jgi:hypothetical protein
MNIYRIDLDKLTRHHWHFQWRNSYWEIGSYTRMTRADPLSRRWVEVAAYHPARVNFTNIEKLVRIPSIPNDVIIELRKRAAKAPVKVRC